jgi:general stress protein YciG
MTDEKNQEESQPQTVADGSKKSPSTAQTEQGTKRKRGFGRMSPEEQRRIASLGGLAAHQTQLAHRFTSEEARQAGKLGGARIASNREYMRQIGAKGGRANKGRKRQQHSSTSAEAEQQTDDQSPNSTDPPDQNRSGTP